MRRPCFLNWIKSELLRTSGESSFNLRKLAALSQRGRADEMIPLLFLYAHEAECTDRLMSFIIEPRLRADFIKIERQLGKRSIERLALRGTPMMSLPEPYRRVLADYERAYHAPEQLEEQKRKLQKLASDSMLKKGLSPAEIARSLSLDPGNMHAYLVRGDTKRFTIDRARKIAQFLQQ